MTDLIEDNKTNTANSHFETFDDRSRLKDIILDILRLMYVRLHAIILVTLTPVRTKRKRQPGGGRKRYITKLDDDKLVKRQPRSQGLSSPHLKGADERPWERGWSND